MDIGTLLTGSTAGLVDLAVFIGRVERDLDAVLIRLAKAPSGIVLAPVSSSLGDQSSGDGLAVTRDIVAGAPRAIRSGGLLALEVDCRRAGAVAALVAASGAFTDVVIRRDYTARDRFVLATRSTAD